MAAEGLPQNRGPARVDAPHEVRASKPAVVSEGVPVAVPQNRRRQRELEQVVRSRHDLPAAEATEGPPLHRSVPVEPEVVVSRPDYVRGWQ